MQVSNADAAEEYELNQVGVFAVLDGDRDPEAEERLLFLMQDEKGVTVPAYMDGSFLLELYCLIGITNNGRFEVSVDAAGVVTAAFLRETLASALAGHNADQTAHPDLRERMAQMREDSERMGSAVERLDGRMSLLELMYGTDVSGNPYTVIFDSLTGLKVSGVWNTALSRLEF